MSRVVWDTIVFTGKKQSFKHVRPDPARAPSGVSTGSSGEFSLGTGSFGDGVGLQHDMLAKEGDYAGIHSTYRLGLGGDMFPPSQH
jgi:hypothetical protein